MQLYSAKMSSAKSLGRDVNGARGQAVCPGHGPVTSKLALLLTRAFRWGVSILLFRLDVFHY